MHYLLLKQKTLFYPEFQPVLIFKKIVSVMLAMIPNAVERFKVRKHNFCSLGAEKADRLASLLTQPISLSGQYL